MLYQILEQFNLNFEIKFSANLVTFTEEIIHGKFHFLYSVSWWKKRSVFNKIAVSTVDPIKYTLTVTAL